MKKIKIVVIWNLSDGWNRRSEVNHYSPTDEWSEQLLDRRIQEVLNWKISYVNPVHGLANLSPVVVNAFYKTIGKI